jgi:RAB protein geranylgeranyltransferase component A
LECVGIYDSSGVVKNVPASKEDVFKSKDISLVNKRRLMRFLMFAVSDFEDKKEFMNAKEMSLHEFLRSTFSLPDEIASAVIYALAFCPSPAGMCHSRKHSSHC